MAAKLDFELEDIMTNADTVAAARLVICEHAPNDAATFLDNARHRLRPRLEHGGAGMTDHIALTDGEWRPVGGIMRWFPTLTSVPEPPPFDPNGVACYSCGATVTQGCRTKSGLATKGHAGRLPRRCPCGDDLLPQRSLCSDCSRANELASKRAASRRWYQEKRSA